MTRDGRPSRGTAAGRARYHRRMKRAATRLPVFVLLLLAVLAACAPALDGGSSRKPVEIGRGSIEMAPGTTVYLLATHKLADLGFREDDLAVVQFVNETPNRSSGRADTWMKVEPLRLPFGWEAGLSTARFVLESGRDPVVQSVIRVTVPASAGLGPAELRLKLAGRRSDVTVNVPVRVRHGGG